MNIKQILSIIVTTIITIGVFIGGIKYNNMRKELNRLKIENLERVDSLNHVNKELEKRISEYEKTVISLEDAIDSLKQVKNKIIVKKDQVIVSKSVSEGIVLLQDNLSKWEE